MNGINSSNLWARVLLVVLIIIAIVLLTMVIWPFASAFFIAAVLAGALFPWQKRLSARLRNKRMLAAGILVFGVILTLVLPLATTGAIAVREALEGIGYVRTTMRSEGVQGLINRLPAPFRKLAEDSVGQAMPDEEKPTDISQLAPQGGKAVAAVGNVIQATGTAILQTVMMLIALFFLLTDGASLVNWLSDNVPMRRVQLKELLHEFRTVSVAVLKSTLATAGVQALAASVGYLIARVPNAVFFTLVTFFVGLIPAVGAASVSIVLALTLVISGRPLMGLFLALWGIIVVGLVDNVVKPLLIRGGMEMHGAIVFFSLLGGLAAFGGIGLLAGPLIVAFFVAMVSMVRREFTDDPVPTRP
jgi:predicted PurR-regulated permease PerM